MTEADRPTLKQVNQILLDLEDDLGLFDRRADGVQYWELVRHSIHKKIVKQTQNLTDSSSDPVQPKCYKPIKIYKNALSELVNNLFNNNPFVTDSADVLFYGGRRRQMEDGSWYNPHTDPIAEVIDYDHVFIEKNFIRRHGGSQKEAPENLRYLTLPDRLGDLIKQLSYTYNLSHDEITILKKFEYAVENRLGIQLNVISEVELELSNRRIRLPLYKNIINRIDPNVCIVCMWPHTIIEACNELNIPVVNLQVTAWDPYYWKYHYPNNRTPKIKPNELFIWGDFWQKAAKLPFHENNIHTVGFPHYERKLEQYSDTPKKNQILFISNPKSGPQLSEMAANFATMKSELNIVYKLHSMEFDTWENNYSKLVKAVQNNQIKIIDQAEGSLHKLLAESQAQVGVSSTAIYEGLGFGIPTFIFDAPRACEVESLIQYKYATLVSDAHELSTKLDLISDDYSPDTNIFFKCGSLNNISKKISYLIH